MATFVATGAIFGAVDVVTVAFAEEQGHKARGEPGPRGVRAGLLRRRAPSSGCCTSRGAAEPRWLLGVCAMAVSMIPLQLVGNLPFLAVALFVAGLSIAPTMVTTMALVEAARTTREADRGHDLDEHRARGRRRARLLRGRLGGRRRRGAAPGTGFRPWPGPSRSRWRSWGTAGSAGRLPQRGGAPMSSDSERRRTARGVTGRGNVTARPAREVTPASVEELAAAVRRAAEDGLKVKAVGTGHSFTAAAATDGVLIRPELLDRHPRDRP